MTNTTDIDHNKLNDFLMKAISDMSGGLGAMMVILGDRLNLYKTLSQNGEMSSQELANATGTAERYVKEWLSSQAASGYINYNKDTQKFFMPVENSLVLADEKSPAFILGGYQILRSIFKDEEKFVEMFKTGKGLKWGEHHHDLFEGTAKFFKPNYTANLIQSWIPSLQGVQEKLKKGGKVADIGCGFGISTVLMAKEFPNSKFFGYDNHKPSIEAAIRLAREEKVENNTEFKVIAANESIGKDYDLIAFFDCLHDMGDPIGALKFAKDALKDDGTCLIVEPMANDRLEDNLNLTGKMFYSASTIICVPNSLADNGSALGAQAGENKIKEIVKRAGFKEFRRANQTPFNLIFELKP